MSSFGAFDTYDAYVANLPLEHTEAQIREIFDVVGEVHSVKLLPPREGMNSRVAFVRFKQEEDAKCAAKYLNNQVLDNDRSITVRYRKKEGSEDTNGHSNGHSNGDVHSNGNSHESGAMVNGNGVQPRSPIERTNNTDNSETSLVVHIESPIRFWTQNTSTDTFVKLQEVTTQLGSLCPSQAKVVGQLSTQQVYACKFSADNMWYRCMVEKCLQKNMAQVRYIDYGNSESVERFSLVTLPASLSTLPPLAECCQLEGLELVDEDTTATLFTEGVEKVTKLIGDQVVDIKIAYKEKQVQFVNIVKIQDGNSLDLPGDLMATGAVKKNIQNIKAREDKIKDFRSGGFSSVPPPNNRSKSPFSMSGSISLTESKSILELEDKLKELESEYQDKLKTLKGESTRSVDELEGKLQACEKHKQQVVFELEKKLDVCTQEKDKVLSELMQKLEIREKKNEKVMCELQSNVVTTKFASLVKKVKSLRQHRACAPNLDEVFPPKMQSIVDLYVNSDTTNFVISLQMMQPYQSIKIEQDALKIQKDLLVKCDASDKEELQELIEEKDEIVRKCAKHIQAFLKHLSTLPLQKREGELTAAKEFLNNNYQDTMKETNSVAESKSSGSTNPLGKKSLERVVIDYKAERRLRATGVQQFRDISNDRSSKLFKTLGQLQRECHCVVSINSTLGINQVDQLMEDYHMAMDNEMKATQKVDNDLKSSSALKGVVNALADAMSLELKDIEFLKSEELEKSYERMLEGYKKVLKSKPDIEPLLQAKAHIKLLKSKYRHKQADITDLEEDSDETNEEQLEKHVILLDEMRLQLHQQLLIELTEMKQLAEASLQDFPELVKLHPELLLPSFVESGCLVQRSRTIDHYPQDMVVLTTRSNQVTYKTTFNGETCIIKELLVTSETYKEILLSVVNYSKNRHRSYADFQCVFTDKAVRKLYLHQDFANEGNILQFIEKHQPDAEMVKSLIKEVLNTLDTSSAIPHGDIKRENVLVNRDEDGVFHAYLAEPNFLEKKDALLAKCLNVHGIIPDYPVVSDVHDGVSHETDVACVGVILLWALHRSSVFSGKLQDDLQTIPKDPLLKDLLRQMLTTHPSERRTASDMLRHPYFTLQPVVSKESGTPSLDVVLINLIGPSIGDKDDQSVREEKTKIADDAVTEETLVSEQLSPERASEPWKEEDESDVSLLCESAETSIVETEVEKAEETNQAEELVDTGSEIDAWVDALLKKKESKKTLGEMLEEKPQDVSISDTDDF